MNIFHIYDYFHFKKMKLILPAPPPKKKTATLVKASHVETSGVIIKKPTLTPNICSWAYFKLLFSNQFANLLLFCTLIQNSV